MDAHWNGNPFPLSQFPLYGSPHKGRFLNWNINFPSPFFRHHPQLHTMCKIQISNLGTCVSTFTSMRPIGSCLRNILPGTFAELRTVLYPFFIKESRGCVRSTLVFPSPRLQLPARFVWDIVFECSSLLFVSTESRGLPWRWRWLDRS